jgi:3',5'-cyclic AMP phosphodiesterase CpdA
MFRLAHVTDPHFRGQAGPRLGELLGKRALGFANLVVNRRRHHKMELLSALQADLRARAVDHLAITGDLSNVSVIGEWEAALGWIEGVGLPAERITVIPGNHDVYVPEVAGSGVFERLFAAYQTAERRDDGPYPFVRLRDGVALLGVNTCVPTGDFGAWGRVGEAQLARLAAQLRAPELEGRTRVVLLHHPPVVHKRGEDRNLRDREALAAVLREAGAELVLHGHDHQDECAYLDGPAGARIPAVGAGSASYAGGPDRRARYNVYEIDAGAITAVTYAHDEAAGGFREVRRQPLDAPPT